MSIFNKGYSVWFAFTFFWSFVCLFFSFHLFFHLSVLPTLILKWDLSKWNRIRERRVPAAMEQKSCAQSPKVEMWRTNCKSSAFSKFETFVKHTFGEGPVFEISEGGQEWKDKLIWISDLVKNFEWDYWLTLNYNLVVKYGILLVCRHPLWLWERVLGLYWQSAVSLLLR